ncbi:MAG: LytR C-terminal domain-containing protein [Gemmatimonadetes bacterium]|nr:LytR C-terminal domain-containing protein [Gemmatimonadota bacterium]MBT4608506.1 LytR C-terminal domain-containing protein [Gemmatimonadota bacterium]MBT5057381.1 LytR C-terminal domain-containing protein [Gemmatimonadota bacterium]MBT5142301.1 LytR C-terminal domain-containing protein [Gemmatimonadota bacterium]MBT5589114.1 LytR C-terminal domain-containing protein [Gemmatimonadota bacterium]
MLERVLWLTASVAGVGLLIFAARPLLDAAGSTPPPQAAHVVLEDGVRIAMLNGAGEPQLAARMTRRARALGLDVIREGNASSFNYLESVVIDRVGNMEQARAIAVLLRIPHTVQQIDDDAYRLEEVEIIIGHDHRRLQLLDHNEGR